MIGLFSSLVSMISALVCRTGVRDDRCVGAGDAPVSDMDSTNLKCSSLTIFYLYFLLFCSRPRVQNWFGFRNNRYLFVAARTVARSTVTPRRASELPLTQCDVELNLTYTNLTSPAWGPLST